MIGLVFFDWIGGYMPKIKTKSGKVKRLPYPKKNKVTKKKVKNNGSY
jgi:hypothetical protein|tara:strand:+ start:184 stop:324 length:141 start_codon:yes stop_codon:yes gene_type:complete